MTTILLMVILYILNIFITRYLNYCLYKMNKFNPIMIFAWFIPIAGLIAFLVIIVLQFSNKHKSNWFNGKYW